jgi:predicted nucleotidyltransferase component of viral defense system
MNFEEIRRLIITALFADDELFEQLVLKGGNALSIVHRLSSRTSLDLDFSMQNDFADLEKAKERIFSTLKARFDSAGLVVFDEKLEVKPDLRGAEDAKPWWGGYELKFKLIGKDEYAKWAHQLEKLRIRSLVTGPNETRTFTVDFSKNEYTEGKIQTEIDHYTIYVYTPEMIVVEKLRAICQQMPEYPHKGRGKPRARDFYDIHRVISTLKIDLYTPENRALLRHIFDAKEVPLSLLENVEKALEFHRPDWDAVRPSVEEDVEEFDFYFGFVLEQIATLKAFWKEQPPI